MKPQISQHDDLLSAFNSSAPVDSSGHFPTSTRGSDSRLPQTSVKQSRNDHTPKNRGGIQLEDNTSADDDDPFGLGQAARASVAKPAVAGVNDDDILGDLAKPVDASNISRRRAHHQPQGEPAHELQRSTTSHDRALAELVDMGFGADQARGALAETASGDDVQVAVSVILNQAHRESSGKSRSQSRNNPAQSHGRPKQTSRRPSGDRPGNDSMPPWMRRQQDHDQAASKSATARDEKELAQYASEIGTSFMKSANTFWKAGQKRVAKAVAEFQPEMDPSKPKWMHDAGAPEDQGNAPRQHEQHRVPSAAQEEVSRTREASLLDESRPSKHPSRTRRPSRPDVGVYTVPTSPPARSSRPEPELPARPVSRPENTSMQPPSRPLGRVNRQMVEDETAQAYVSPARRKKQPPKPEAAPESSLDIFSTELPTATTVRSLSTPATQRQPQSISQSSRSHARPKTIARETPPVSASALNASHSRRREGTDAFKRGDYASAHTSYTAALTPLPPTHAITIVLRCNRALTSLKIGEPRSAIEDANAAIATIGPSAGEGESISLGNEGEKPMRESFGKALMRKAEAYEQMEKWTDAAKVWREAVEAGVGGAVAIQGRNRCDKASGAATVNGNTTNAPVRKTVPARPKATIARPSALADLNGSAESEAVKRLREQAVAAAAASDEAFALTDSVDARLTSWKAGKADNLRALLASLDTILWPEAGWKKVGMGDIVLPNKVKVVYMKAIAKVHPDKVSIHHRRD